MFRQPKEDSQRSSDPLLKMTYLTLSTRLNMEGALIVILSPFAKVDLADSFLDPMVMKSACWGWLNIKEKMLQ